MTQSNILFRNILYILTLLLFSACQAETDPTPEPITLEITPIPTATRQPSPTPWPTRTPTPTPTETPTPAPTEPSIDPAQLEAAMINLDLQASAAGVSFNYSNILFDQIVSSRESPRLDGFRTLDEDVIILDGVPDHIVFRGPISRNSTRPPLLVVQAIVDGTGFFYPAYEIADQEYFNKLRQNSLTRPPLHFVFAQDAFVVQPKYVDFANGQGISAVRYLPSNIDGQPEEITNRQLFYTYEGITENGRFYVWFQFPIQAESLPNEATFSERQLAVLAVDEDNFTIYQINEMEQVRRSIENGKMTPPRTVLDELVESIMISKSAGGEIATVSTPLPPVTTTQPIDVPTSTQTIPPTSTP